MKGTDPKVVRCPYPMLTTVYMYSTVPTHVGLFNHTTQCARLGLTSCGAYRFVINVAPEVLRVVNMG